jgi:hypothetical protein
MSKNESNKDTKPDNEATMGTSQPTVNFKFFLLKLN